MTKPTCADDVEKLLAMEDIPYVKVGVFDVDGILRGKHMHRDKFLSALKNGFGFCDVVLGWDSNDQLYDCARFTGWHTAYPDVRVQIVPDSMRRLSTENDIPFFLGEFADKGEEVCPRGTLRRVLNKAQRMGFRATAGFEFEFFLFEETSHSVRDKGFRDLKPITPGFFGYSLLRSGLHSEYHEEFLNMCLSMDMPLEGLHTETGPGVMEAALQKSGALEAADRAALFKTFTKIFAQKKGWMATFMAKWSNDWPGQSGHIHMSLEDEAGKNIFFDRQSEHTMSEAQRWFVGGQQALIPELLAMVAPTVNSYRRLVPGFWAPTEASWGIENRTCALRVISGEKAQRVEYRIAAADINPYIALAAALGSGLWGIENKVEPLPPTVGNAYEQTFPSDLALPQTLTEASGRLRASSAAVDLFGAAFVEHYAQSREWEEREFRKAVTNWELDRYFEII